MNRYFQLLTGLVLLTSFSFIEDNTLNLANYQTRLQWKKTAKGWSIDKVMVRFKDKWIPAGTPSGEYTILYTPNKPDSISSEILKTNTGQVFIDPSYKYVMEIWKQNTSPVSLNKAGTAYHFYPESGKLVSKNRLSFKNETEVAIVTSDWTLDPAYPTDVLVTQTITAKKSGYFSMASPSVAIVPESDLKWAAIPGYFQGNEIQKDFVLAYAYGNGIPDRPVVYKEKCAAALSPIVSLKNGITLSVAPKPGLERDPWKSTTNTHQDWHLGLSHMNYKSVLSPTIYHPVLGQAKSYLQIGETRSFQFRYSFIKGDWFAAYEHVVNDVFKFPQSLKLKHNKQSLTKRVERIQSYVQDTTTSLWRTEYFNGQKIGGQAYLAGVHDSQNDAMKNADYGAMWMLGNIGSDTWLKNNVLPDALNFKLAQQEIKPGFFQGAASGQYYLSKSKKFVEEWGAFVEPISLTYYTLLDMGNILLFEPENKVLKKRLQLGADLLLKWQKNDGSWEVAYDKLSHQPIFTDLKDLRPTFYGLIVAYRILKDPKYLAAAKKGADWFIENAVKKGHFIGVCGDFRYAPDFATGQSAQALLDLYDLTKEKIYLKEAISTAKIYTTSIYTQPVPSNKEKQVKGHQKQDWEITQSGLSFEHGGTIGSANRHGPILLCSHAGMFTRMFQLTKDSLFINMARAAAIGRDAFLDDKTSVASYYWDGMNRGAGSFPHHGWWQIGWIVDYLLSEANLRSDHRIVFPRGFIAPKVGPHQTYGFSPGKIYDHLANLIIRKDIITSSSNDLEYITALSPDKETLYLVLLNDVATAINVEIKLNPEKLALGNKTIAGIMDLRAGKSRVTKNTLNCKLEPYGLNVFAITLH